MSVTNHVIHTHLTAFQKASAGHRHTPLPFTLKLSFGCIGVVFTHSSQCVRTRRSVLAHGFVQQSGSDRRHPWIDASCHAWRMEHAAIGVDSLADAAYMISQVRNPWRVAPADIVFHLHQLLAEDHPRFVTLHTSKPGVDASADAWYIVRWSRMGRFSILFARSRTSIVPDPPHREHLPEEFRLPRVVQGEISRRYLGEYFSSSRWDDRRSSAAYPTHAGEGCHRIQLGIPPCSPK